MFEDDPNIVSLGSYPNHLFKMLFNEPNWESEFWKGSGCQCCEDITISEEYPGIGDS